MAKKGKRPAKKRTTKKRVERKKGGQTSRSSRARERREAGLPVRRPVINRTPKQVAECKAIFLATLRQSGNVRLSCEAAGIARSLSYEWRADDDTFKALWKEAIEDAIDLLEQEAWRRGHDGIDKPVIYKGRITQTYKEYSDRMLEILLKAHRKKFREKHELTGEDGGPIIVKRIERIIVDPKDNS